MAVALISGTIEAITLHNINKAAGHFTYNVDVRVRREDGGEIIVRVAKVAGDDVPHPLAQVISVESWGSFVVGSPFAHEAEVTSAALALLR